MQLLFPDAQLLVTVPRMHSYCSLDGKLLFHGCGFCPGNAPGEKGKIFEFFLQTSICMIEIEAFKRQSCFEFTLPLS